MTSPDASFLDKPTGNELGGFAPNGKANSLRRGDDRRVYTDDFSRAIYERTARIARV